jgi:hypothetical protein
MSLFDRVTSVVNAHRTPTTHPTPDLPTVPGLYVAKGDTDLTGVTVYLLDVNGFWWSLIHEAVSREDVQAHAGPRELERLVRHSEVDL